LHGFEGKSSGLIRIEVDLINEKYVSLIISDNGNGMSPAECEKAFDPFFTTKLGCGGSGLGLNLVYNLTTTILGGTVDITSTIDMGVSLNFKFPIIAPGVHKTQGYV
jgi:signal transduction histidine kinase